MLTFEPCILTGPFNGQHSYAHDAWWTSLLLTHKWCLLFVGTLKAYFLGPLGTFDVPWALGRLWVIGLGTCGLKFGRRAQEICMCVSPPAAQGRL